MKEMSDLQTALQHPLRSVSAAIRFLTVFPGLSKAQLDQEYFGPARYYFTIVGLITGCVVALCGVILQTICAPLVTAVLLTVLLSSVSGFLHLDGLADTADGFLSSRSREHILEIMRDSRIGVMGAVAVCSLLLVKSAALYSLDRQFMTGALVCATAASRTAMVAIMYFLPYARSGGGLGLLFKAEENGSAVVVLSFLLLLFTLVLLLPAKLLVLICAFLIVFMIFSVWCMKKIGGYTGDTVGCLCELMEGAILLAAGLAL